MQGEIKESDLHTTHVHLMYTASAEVVGKYLCKYIYVHKHRIVYVCPPIPLLSISDNNTDH